MGPKEVVEVLDYRKKGKNMEYLVGWAPTWEAETDLSCKKLLNEFKAKNGSNGTEEEEDGEREEEVEEKSGNTGRRGAPRKAAPKREAPAKGCPKPSKRR